MDRDPAGRPYRLDPADPRAPSQAAWEAMTEAERARVLDELPCEFEVTEANPPEGDAHFDAKVNLRDTLYRHFRRAGRGVYIGCELPVYYPDEPMFAPDVMVVLDVQWRRRNHWTVSAEGKGLDVAIEIHHLGHRAKDVVKNVERYARLGIPEYFVFEARTLRLRGYRLAPGQRVYQPILPQGGQYASEVLGVELGIEDGRLRAYLGLARLPETDELLARLDAAMQEMSARSEEAERRAEDEARRAEDEARRAEDTERKLAEALAELARLKGEGQPAH